MTNSDGTVRYCLFECNFEIVSPLFAYSIFFVCCEEFVSDQVFSPSWYVSCFLWDPKIVSVETRKILWTHVFTVNYFFLKYLDRKGDELSCVVAGKMFPRRPTTHQSPKTPKGRNEQAGEASSSRTKAIEFSSKMEPVIKMSQKKPTNPPPLYKDIVASSKFKVLLPTWLDLYNKIYHDDFPEFTPHSDLEVRVLDD